jgi:DNA-binding CsgD family transcriptional regulator
MGDSKNRMKISRDQITTELGRKIWDLKNNGHSYNDITEKLKCSKSTISYHLSRGGKERVNKRRRQNRADNIILKKIHNFLYTDRATENTKREHFGVDEFLKKFGKNPKCYLTGKKVDLNDTTTYSLDHVIAVTKGGHCTIDNCGVVTQEANQLKGSLSLQELKKLCKQILKNI